MSSILLSIVVPTKDRIDYLKALIKIVSSFNRLDVELVIEDNSDNNTEMLKFLEAPEYQKIVYNYERHPIPVVENCDRAILHSSGKYVCFMGDDDLLSERACEFVEYMDRYGYDSSIFQVAKYYWPGNQFIAHEFPNLVIKNFKEKITEIDIDREFDLLLEHGATSLHMMPKVYHGIVLRERLDQIYSVLGTFFPGPSPDMSNAVGLATVVKKHIYCDVPFISSGTSPKSTAGQGLKHKHQGNLKDISFLPKDIDTTWNASVPKVWTGPTIYAQSAIYALNKLKRKDMLEKFNFNYHYAYFAIFCPSYKPLLKRFLKENDKYRFSHFYVSFIKIFLIRVKEYIKNIKLKKFKSGAILKMGVSDTLQAEKYIDDVISKVNMDQLFSDLNK